MSLAALSIGVMLAAGCVVYVNCLCCDPCKICPAREGGGDARLFEICAVLIDRVLSGLLWKEVVACAVF